MDIKKIIERTKSPKPYDVGTANMWTDKHISDQLLAMHLDKTHDIASRSDEKIDSIVKCISHETNAKKLKMLDLGCGPGLYTQKFANHGHEVTGIDFSKNSILHAKKSAKEKELDIEYICQNYLEMDYEEEFDGITLIYCDFGVLSVLDRKVLMSKIFKALKKGGIFIFDALNQNITKSVPNPKAWEYSDGGFWSKDAYIAFSEGFHFKEQKATLDQHIVISGNDYKIYRFWNHYFDKQGVETMFKDIGFCDIKALDIKLAGGTYNGDDVTFYKVTK